MELFLEQLFLLLEVCLHWQKIIRQVKCQIKNDGNMNGRKQKKEDNVCIVRSHQIILVTFVVYIRKKI